MTSATSFWSVEHGAHLLASLTNAVPGVVFQFGLVSMGFWSGSALMTGLLLLPTSEAVCIHCKDTIPGCTGGDNCPAFKDWSTNSAIFKDKTLTSAPRVAHALC